MRSRIGCAAAVAAALTFAAGCSGSKKNAGSEFAVRQVGALTLPARVEGRSVEAATKNGFAPIWAGVNLGSTIPGRQPGGVAATRQDYATCNVATLGTTQEVPYTADYTADYTFWKETP